MRYYSTQRPITPGAYPKENVISIKNFHDKKYVSEIGGDAWGYVEYDCELPEEKVRAYEFTPVNPMHCTAKQLAAMKRILSRGQKAMNAAHVSGSNFLVNRFVITRTFKEVSGKDIKKIRQVAVRFSDAEREVYRTAIESFERMRSRYFASTGNLRKDAMMRLIQQITLLLRISAAPNTVEEYHGGLPTKIAKVMGMLDDAKDEIVAIGVRHKNVVNAYADAIRDRFPDRPLFVVTGSTTTLAARRKLRKTLKESGNGILLCTQQSLPSSVNFEFVDTVIIPELHYNNSRMSQFYMRFIRYNSTRMKNIYFVTYLGSIESNQMQMVLAKEKLNLFMRGQDTDLDEIYERFGVDYDLLSVLMSREMDENGKMYLKWGEQNIA